MKIRSITFFTPHSQADGDWLATAGACISAARQAFEAAGYEVQTLRLASPPFSEDPTINGAEDLIQRAQALEASALPLGFDYISLGPAVVEAPGSYAAIPAALSATRQVFFSGMLSSRQGEISLPAVRQCAEVIQRCANILPDGFANLRFAALANVPPGSPFLPAAYHRGEHPAFALALEAADLAVQAFSQASTLSEARSSLVASMQAHAGRLQAVASQLSDACQVEFGGIDFSLAPFPSVDTSLGTALERLGVPALGQAGSLAAAAFLTDCIDRARFQRTGFSGLMLPVLEDATLARRAADGSLSVRELLLYSAVCGIGLDTVPLPGDCSVNELAAILLDLAALAYRLDKPLTARLMPIPGKVAGDPTGFDFAYFANSRVMPIQSNGLLGLFTGDEQFGLIQRPGCREGQAGF